jgi:signal transduction histidine kinase
MFTNLAIFTLIATAATAFGYAGLVLYTVSRVEKQPARSWFLAYLIFSIVLLLTQAAAMFNWQYRNVGSSLPVIFSYWLSLGLLGVTSAQFARQKRPFGWLPACCLPALAILAVEWLRIFPAMYPYSWLQAVLGPQPLLPIGALFAWAFGFAVLFGMLLLKANRLSLPLHANRLLWWAGSILVIALGEATAVLLPTPLAIAGLFVRWLGVACLAYALGVTELVDIRHLLRTGFGYAILVVITTSVILLGITVGTTILADKTLQGWRALALLLFFAFSLAIIFQFLRQITNSLIEQLILRFNFEPTQITTQYARRIANILEYEDLAVAVAETLQKNVNARAGALLLLTADASRTVYVEVFPGSPKVPTTPFQFNAANPFLQIPLRSRQPVLQYAVDVNAEYRALTVVEREWLTLLRMDVFVPIFDGNEMIGMIAVGPNLRGDPFRQREFELMMAIAEQTTVALKNARLFAAQRQLNAEMQKLNEDLRDSNQQLAEMDRVKTDFLTIASHELRTPLTQVRGFTDVLDTLNDSNVLTPKQIGDITQSLLRACDRLDAVIGQMLDVSQIDVEAMQLKFVETTLDAVLRLAIEPYADAIRERQQTLKVRGLRGLPTLLIDFQRMVQAFGHLVSNAIKYTPDKGLVDITALLLPATAEQPESVKISIRDSGVGIDPKYHHLIFEKFFRIGSTALHSTSTTNFMGAGPGLGLPIARGVIEGHGGKIWVESLGFDKDACPGTTFHILLPLRPPNIPRNSKFSLDPNGRIPNESN